MSTALRERKVWSDRCQDMKVNNYLAKGSTRINGDIRIFPDIHSKSTKLTLQKNLKRILYIGEGNDTLHMCAEKIINSREQQMNREGTETGINPVNWGGISHVNHVHRENQQPSNTLKKGIIIK